MLVIDPNSEILRQLTRIADAATKSSGSPWLEWVKTIASFIAGLYTAYLSDLMRTRSSDRKEQTRLRKIVYYELARCFLDIHALVGTETKLRRVRFQVMKELCAFDGEAYIKQNPAIFYSLPEAELIKGLYHRFHNVGPGDSKVPKKYGLVEMKAPLGLFSDCFRTSAIFKKNLKKLIDSHEYSVIENAVKQYKFSFTMEEMVDSGLMEIIDPSKQESSPS